MKLFTQIVLVACIAGGFLTGATGRQKMKDELLTKVDHLVFATPDLAAGVDHVERVLGFKAVPGGQHPGGGTRNALIGLGGETYLEIIGPDPDQPKPPRPRRFTIDDLKTPRLVTWAAKGTDLEAIVQNARRNGVDLGSVQAGGRRRPDGVLLSWRLTVSPSLTADGLIPFFIDWGKTTNPAAGLPKGCELIAMRAEHPDALRIHKQLSALGVGLPVSLGSAAAIIATIRTPKGDIELR